MIASQAVSSVQSKMQRYALRLKRNYKGVIGYNVLQMSCGFGIDGP